MLQALVHNFWKSGQKWHLGGWPGLIQQELLGAKEAGFSGWGREEGQGGRRERRRGREGGRKGGRRGREGGRKGGRRNREGGWRWGREDGGKGERRDREDRRKGGRRGREEGTGRRGRKGGRRDREVGAGRRAMADHSQLQPTRVHLRSLK